MSYQLTYWHVVNKNGADCLKTTRISSVNEIEPLSLEHNRPFGCDAILLERTDRYVGRKKELNVGQYERLIWANERGSNCDVITSVKYNPTKLGYRKRR